MKIDKKAVRGELPDAVFKCIDWRRLEWFVQEAFLAQSHKVRTPVLDAASEGNAGPVVDVEIQPFDGEGGTLVLLGGQPLLKLHVSRLMPWNPLALDEMERR